MAAKTPDNLFHDPFKVGRGAERESRNAPSKTARGA